MARKPDSHHVLPLFCDDLIASCVDMTPACFGAYMRLLCYAWTRGGIPDDEAACARITGGMEPGDWSAIRSRLLVMDDGRLTHQRLELERVAVSEIREKRAEAGRMGGRPKANGKQTESKTKANGKQNESKTKAPYPSPSLPYTREEIQPASPVAPSTPQRRRCSKPADPLRWSAESGWVGITDADHAEWSQAYPAADLPVELAKANQWLKANPKKARKSNWRRWLTTVWLSKCQDRGGTHREAARQAAPPPVDQAKRRYWRGDAAQNMTDSEYAVWRREQRHGGVAVALAQSLKLTDENT
jgi:uncharacterized protein YdaU (DUF1376 family)